MRACRAATYPLISRRRFGKPSYQSCSCDDDFADRLRCFNELVGGSHRFDAQSLQWRPRTRRFHERCALVMGCGSLRNKGRPDRLYVISCWGKEQHQSQIMFTRIVCLLLALVSVLGVCGTDFAMKVTDKNYLDTQGFSVFLYDSTYHPVFVDQKNTAMDG